MRYQLWTGKRTKYTCCSGFCGQTGILQGPDHKGFCIPGQAEICYGFDYDTYLDAARFPDQPSHIN